MMAEVRPKTESNEITMLPERITILLVDDDEDDYLAISRLVKRVAEPRCKLEWCASFDKAKELIAQHSHDLDLVDDRLGAHSGLDLLKMVEPDKRPEPFIVLTDVGDRTIERQA